MRDEEMKTRPVAVFASGAERVQNCGAVYEALYFRAQESYSDVERDVIPKTLPD
jgi:hypothetical protein